MITVFGTVNPSSDITYPAVADYTIDVNSPTTLPLPQVTQMIPYQQLFQSTQLTPGQHTLVVNVTTQGSPYTIDFLQVCGNGGPAPAPTPAKDTSKAESIIIGTVLGVLLLIVLVALVYVLWRDGRRSRSRIGWNPLRQWLQRRTSFFPTSVPVLQLRSAPIQKRFSRRPNLSCATIL